jgi:hypothetical protein
LQNSRDNGNPIRVIRGHELKNSYTGKVYTYDGLYKVFKLNFLLRIADQTLSCNLKVRNNRNTLTREYLTYFSQCEIIYNFITLWLWTFWLGSSRQWTRLEEDIFGGAAGTPREGIV